VSSDLAAIEEELLASNTCREHILNEHLQRTHPRSAGYRRGTAPEDIVGGPLQVDGLDLPSLHRSTTGLAKGRATNRDHNLVVDCRRGGPGQRTPPWVTRPEDAATGDPRRHDNAGEAEMGRRRHCW